MLLMVLAIGVQVDTKQIVDSPRAECYHSLARAALAEMPIMEHPDVELMQCLVRMRFPYRDVANFQFLAQFYMMWYLILWSDKENAAIYAWTVMGLTAKLSQAVSYIF